MIPIRTHDTPGTATAPRAEGGELVGSIGPLPYGIEYTEFREGTFATLVTIWRPEPAELEALLAGGAVKVSLLGVSGIPPMKVEAVSFGQAADRPL